jgi:hypothetical protein
MIILASLNDKAAHRGTVYATTMRPIEGLPLIECLRPTFELVHGFKYWGKTAEWYTEGYRRLLQQRWPQVKAWLDSLTPDEDITLVCYCRQDGFCHRRLVARLITKWRPDIPLDIR